MKSITESIRKLTPENQKELALFLKCEQSGEKAVTRAVLSRTGLQAILKDLTPEERNIIRLVYGSEGDGITLGELEKKIQTGIAAIEEMTVRLSHRLLVYVIKNRQLLTNKLDKVYAIEEVAALLSVNDPNEILEKISDIRACLEEKSGDPALLRRAEQDPKTMKLLQHIADEGGMVLFDDISALFPPSALNGILDRSAEGGFLSIYNTLYPDLRTYILLNERLLPLMIPGGVSEGLKPGTTVNNGYRFILNMLYAYDSISTYGLFLTKQMQFRKIDYRRVVASMITLRNFRGEPVDQEMACRLAFFFLARLRLLKLQKDISRINISGIRSDLEHPHTLIAKMLHSLDDSRVSNNLFSYISDIPSYRLAQLIIRTIHALGETDYRYLRNAILAAMIIESGKKNFGEMLSVKSRKIREVDSALDMLCLLGVVRRTEKGFSLSDAGYETAAKILRLKIPEPSVKPEKCVYINPDFSLMVPVQELPSISLYYIMSWTEMKKDDIILNAQMNRASIVRAHKRGLSIKPFLDTLMEFSKNEIPQNLKFQLTEWSRQTLSITVTESILMKSNHPNFLEDILYSGMDPGAIEIISPNYAIVSRERLDDIIRLAEKHNAVISLFEETQGEEQQGPDTIPEEP
jgi:hypothetical protein